MLKILVLGATSAIAHHTLRHFAADGASLFLVGRDPQKLVTVQQDLQVRGAKQVETYALDLNLLEEHPKLLETAIQRLGGLDAVLMAHGTLGDQQASQASVELTLQELQTNFISAVSLLTLIANYMEGQRRGAIAVISSVAGDRGRASNYVYGSAMAAKTAFLQGLRNRMAKCGVAVLTVKPGFVDTPMTAHVPKNALFADPADVGKRIYQAMKAGQDVIYVPFFWRYIMLIIIHLPEFIFKRLSL
jgi:short-subunit dehydrogenase